ncbi:hypothetical protein AB0B89_20025 [Sphaerisporangium sp. NPDC049002]|uniref:hypothetical protein n=1 Tax=Sphaerisporangium sp. NPDC049002 TaxID=3155392 RepID=UPI00340F7032
MPNIGIAELLLLIVMVAAVAAVVVVIVAVTRFPRKRRGAFVPPPRPTTPQDLHRVVTQLTLQRQQIHAIKELRQYTGLDLRNAKAVVDAVAMGGDMWIHPAMAPFKPVADAAPPLAARPDLAGARGTGPKLTAFVGLAVRTLINLGLTRTSETWTPVSEPAGAPGATQGRRRRTRSSVVR